MVALQYNADATDAIAIIPAARPSIPSIKFTALIEPIMANIANGIINIPIFIPLTLDDKTPGTIKKHANINCVIIFSFSVVSDLIGISSTNSSLCSFSTISA